MLLSAQGQAWDNHALLTRLSLASCDQWEKVPFEPLEKVLPVLNVGGLHVTERESFFRALEIRGAHVKWDDPGPAPEGADSAALTLMAWASDHPDQGMDQEMHLSPDQEYMGGYTGLSSQAFRHMFYLGWDWRQPLISLHYPGTKLSMGQAPDRAQLFFDLAVQAKNTGHWYWAYRFLGMAMHYVQDLNQPYHDQQFGSLVLLPYLKTLKGKKAFLDEATRIVGNFHLAFERHTEFYIDKALSLNGRDEFYSRITDVFRVPTPSAHLKSTLQNNMEYSVKDGVILMARAGAMLTPSVIREQMSLMEKELLAPELDLISGFFDASGAPKLKFQSWENIPSTGVKKKREQLMTIMTEALSNMGLSTRWVFDKFRLMGR